MNPYIDPLNRSNMADSIKNLASIEEIDWRRSYLELVRYKKKYGISIVPVGDKTYPVLSRWATSQVSFYQAGKLPKIFEDLLSEIGFRFELATTKSDLKWEAMCQRYKSYRATNYSLVVNRIAFVDPELANWINNSRTQVKRNNMSEERMKMLKEMDFKLDFRFNDPWATMFKQLKAFVELHGKSSEQKLMRGIKSKENKKLRNWVRTQRQAYFKHRLTLKRMEMLTAIGIAGWSTLSFLQEEKVR